MTSQCGISNYQPDSIQSRSLQRVHEIRTGDTHKSEDTHTIPRTGGGHSVQDRKTGRQEESGLYLKLRTLSGESMSVTVVQSVDYLGRWEVEGGMETATDVMRDLIKRGLQADYFVPRAELFINAEKVSLCDVNSKTKKEIWSYSAETIRDPVAFVNNKSSGFSRVLIFTVLGVGHFHSNPVMFALQCLDSDPSLLVEKLLDISEETGRIRSPSKIEPPSSYAGVHRRGSSTATSMFGSISSQREVQRKPIPFQSPRLPDTVQKTESLGFDKPSFVYDHSEDPIQKDTILLNYCIGDIEAKCKNLKESRNQVSDSSLDALDQYQATDFISIFQKVKLAFNLLGRLNPHIREPNAADLVHHLFPPLAFLMDACLDLFDEDVQREVASPFLTQTAITLLQHCLSSREIKIWEACGDYWRLPWSELSGAPRLPYKPVFQDGWSPGYIAFTQDDKIATSPISTVPSDPQTSRSRPSTSMAPPPIQNKSDTESDYGSDGSVYNVGKYSGKTPSHGSQSGQEEWRDRLIARGSEIALVTYTREGHNQRELSVMKGDYLEVLNNEKKWWKARNIDSEVGFVPYTILKSLVYKDAPTYWEDAQREKKASQRRDRRRTQSPDQRPPSPSRSISPAPSMVSVVPPPPPQPVWQEPTPMVLRKTSKKKEKYETSAPSMTDELKHVLSFYSEDKASHLDIHKTPDIFIDQRSTPREVKEWLLAKQFSDRVLKQMEGHSGRQVLGLQKQALEAAFGKEEGGRLDSQIILSRNHTKFTQGKNSELRAILEKAKKRAEKKKSQMEDQDTDDSKV